MLKHLLYRFYERRLLDELRASGLPRHLGLIQDGHRPDAVARYLCFCDAHWPASRRLDFLRAIRSYQQRQRRVGQ